MVVTISADNGELLAAAADGDQAAWAVLVDRYHNLLWSVASGFRIDAADAADAVQNTWLRLVENLDRVQDPQRLGAWLATTTRRECLQLIRRAARDRTDPATEHLEQLPDPDDPVDADLLLGERDAALWRALRTLSERCQRLLRVLMATPPPSYADVAAALDMAIGTIGPTRQRCLDRLRTVAYADGLLRGGAEEPS